MGPQFYCVVGNRDHLKVKEGDSFVKRPLWGFIDGTHHHWLTSLFYLKKMEVPPGHRFFDCGAWSYKADEMPRWTPAECVDRYAAVASDGDLVAAPDHMILQRHDDSEQARRGQLTLENAREFLRLCPSRLVPVGVVHGNDIATRVKMAEAMLAMGYTYLAVGSIAGRAGNRKFVSSVLDALCDLRERRPFRMHVLGISALSWYEEYRRRRIESYDGSAMFFAAFTGAAYYWTDDNGTIIKYSVREATDPTLLPECDCPACVPMRQQGNDIRLMGSNEHNMGRAIHNINIYLKALRRLQRSPGSSNSQRTLF